VKQVFKHTRTNEDDPDVIESELLLKFVQAVKAFDTAKGILPSTYLILALSNPINVVRLRGAIQVSKRAFETYPNDYAVAMRCAGGIEDCDLPAKQEDEHLDLHCAIRQLSGMERMVVEERLRGRTMKSIHHEIGIPYEKVKYAYYKAVRKLKVALT
jgi:DNA-directed RNA polymerase specialized sigma24 family protein